MYPCLDTAVSRATHEQDRDGDPRLLWQIDRRFQPAAGAGRAPYPNMDRYSFCPSGRGGIRSFLGIGIGDCPNFFQKFSTIKYPYGF